MPDEDKPKTSKRKRWEVRSRESFETSLALALESPNQVCYSERPKSSLSLISHKKKVSKREKNIEFEDDEDVASAKLSALLDNAKDGIINNGYYPPKLRDSEESLIDSELRKYFNPSQYDANPSAPPMTPDKVPKTPKKKVSMKVTPVHSNFDMRNSKIAEQLKQLSEDIVDSRQAMNNESTIPAIAVSGMLLGPSTSTFNGSVSTIYCERFNNFVMSPESINKFNDKPQQVQKKNIKKEHAFQIQAGFRTFSVFCQGLLSGLSIAHCLMIFLLQENVSVLLFKNGLECTFYILITILSSICVVGAFDRDDLAGTGVLSEQGVRIPWNPLLYFLLITLNLIIIRAEDFISHYETEENHYKKDTMIYWWKFMCLSRSVFSLLAWLGIVNDPHADALKSRVAELSEE